MTAPRADVCVVGAGLVGLATAHALIQTRPGLSVVVLDKERRVATHQSGHNSGVIHSGLYYRPGSLKARLAVEGARLMYDFCEAKEIVAIRSGKLVVATSAREVEPLGELEKRGRANGLEGLRMLSPEEIAEVEPAVTGLAALHVPPAGVTDFRAVAEAMADDLVAKSVELRLGARVESIHNRASSVEVVAGDEAARYRYLVNCAGLHSDRIAMMAGVVPAVRIVPFRGEYFTLVPDKSDLVKGLIYPVPDPRFPFLGVHFTRRWDGSVEVGPNALLALGREHYRGVRPNVRDVGEILRYPGFWRLAGRHVGSGARELINSKWRRRYASLARRLVPAVEARDLSPGGAGVRAQAVDRAGRIVDDFVIESTDSAIHVLNAPSPGATASLAIGRHIASLTINRLE